MYGQNALPARRAWAIGGFSALALLVVVAAFDNQWTQNWRMDQIGGESDDFRFVGRNSWLSTPILHLSALSWRASPQGGEPGRLFASALVGAVLAVVLTGLVIVLLCRGLNPARGRWTLFLGTWAAVGVGTGLALVVEALVGGGPENPLGDGTTYYRMLGEGFQFALYAGWLIGLIAVLVYSATGGTDSLSDTAEYNSPPGYDYGAATPANYSYGYGGYDQGPTHTAPVQQQPYDPYGNSNRSY